MGVEKNLYGIKTAELRFLIIFVLSTDHQDRHKRCYNQIPC